MRLPLRAIPLICLAAVATTFAQTPASHALPAGVAFRDLRYSDASAGRGTMLDLYVPAKPKGPVPVIVYIHGGGWLEGDKSDFGGADGAMRLGYAAVTINYRLSGEAAWPAQIQDCKAAIRWLRLNAAKYNLDPDRICVWGDSAGGHLAALLGTTGDSGDATLEGKDNPGASTRVQCVVDDFGPTDLASIAEQLSPAEAAAIFKAEPNALTRLLDGPAATRGPTTRPGQSRKDELWAMSPMKYVTKDDAPTFILHGDRDPIVPLAQSQSFDAALRAAGVESRLVVLPGAGHGGAEFYTPQTLAPVVGFLARHLRPTP